MGVIYTLNNRYLKNQNANLINSFSPILNLWLASSNNINTNLNSHLLGKRAGFYIININHHIQIVKQILQFSKQVSTSTTSKILFIHNSLNHKFDGLIKLFALRCGEHYYIGKWRSGEFTKKTKYLAYKTVVIYNPEKAKFLIKEINKVGIPTIALSNINTDFFEIMYPMLSNNTNANSMFYISLMLSNSIIEGKLINHIETVNKN